MIQVRYRKVFVGGIDSRVTEEDLRAHFELFGAVTGCTIHRNRDTGRSRGFGFVTFKDAATVEEVQNGRPHTVRDCEVTTKRAVPRELFQIFDGILTVNKVFVGGLRETVAEEDLTDYFSHFGRVRRVDVMVDRVTQARRGFAFVEFDDYDPVDKVVLQGTHLVQGQEVTVRKAKSRLEMELLRYQAGEPQGRPPPNVMRRRSAPFQETRAFPSALLARASLDSFDWPYYLDHARQRGRFF